MRIKLEKLKTALHEDTFWKNGGIFRLNFCRLVCVNTQMVILGFWLILIFPDQEVKGSA